MRFSNFSYIVVGNLVEKKWRTSLAIFVIAFAVAVALAVTAVTGGLMKGLQDRAGALFPPTVLMVKPKTVALAMLAFNTATIDDSTLEKIRQLPGVDKVEPQLSLRVPLRMEVEIAGQYAVTDAVVIGVAPDSMRDEVKINVPFEYDELTSQPIPCVVPRLLLDMYNLAYADSIGLPKLNEDFLIGKRFTMVLGETYLAGSGSSTKGMKLVCQVVGMVSDASLVPGVYVPMEYAAEINRWYSGTDNQPYTALRLHVSRPDQVEPISKALSDMGLLVEGKQWAYESVTLAVRSGTVLLYVFALMILLVAGFSILNLFGLIMAYRMDEIQLLTAVGSTKSTLRWMYFSEALAIAAAGVLIGGGLVFAGLTLIERFIRSRLEKLQVGDLGIIPDRLFAFDLIPVTCVILIVVGISVIAPLAITWKATGSRRAGGKSLGA